MIAFEEDSELALLVVGAVGIVLAYHYLKKGGSAVANAVSNTVTQAESPVLDWASSTSNPFSDDAEDMRFANLVNQALQDQGQPAMTSNEAILARGYGPGVGLYGPAAQYKDNWFIQANPSDCVNAAVAVIIQRRQNSTFKNIDLPASGNSWD